MRRLYRASIWHPSAIPANEWKYRNLKRVLLPVIDVALLCGGLAGVIAGIPAIGEFFTEPVEDLFSGVFAFAALVCLVGVSFPDRWLIEIAAKSLMIGLMLAYGVALFILTGTGDPHRAFVISFVVIAIALMMWRLSLLGGEWADRRAQEDG